MKFKVGDVVYSQRYGKGLIVRISGSTLPYQVEFTDYSTKLPTIYAQWCDEDELEIHNKKLTPRDLTDGDIITLRNGEQLILINGDFLDKDENYDNMLCELDELNEDFTYDNDDQNFEIIRIERPQEYKTIYERPELIEMSIEDVERELGYKIKIKEDK